MDDHGQDEVTEEVEVGGDAVGGMTASTTWELTEERFHFYDSTVVKQLMID